MWPASALFPMDDNKTTYSRSEWGPSDTELHIWKSSQFGKTSEDHTINKSSLAGVLLGWQIELIEQTGQQSEFQMPQMCMDLYLFFKWN